MLKLLGVLGVVWLALFATTGYASAASEWESEGFPAAVKGEEVEGPHALTIEGGLSLECTGVDLKGDLYSPSETLRVAPEYSGCKAFGFLSATVKPNECIFELSSGEELESGNFKGQVGIDCPPEAKIAVLAGSCELQIGDQSGLTSVEFINGTESSPPDVLVDMSLSGLKYTKTKDGFLCPFAGTGELSNGTYGGAALLTGSAEGSAVAIAVELKLATMLCKAKPNPACTGAIHTKGTVISAVSEVNAQNPIEISIYEIGNPDVKRVLISCDKGTLVATTSEDKGTPLGIEKATAEFETCATSKTSCAKGKIRMENTSVFGSIEASGVTPGNLGNGTMFIPVVLRLECGAEVNCKYQAVGDSPLPIRFAGATVAALGVSAKLGVAAVENPNNCYHYARWNGYYPVSSPTGIWPSH